MYCSQVRPMLIAIATVVSVSLRMNVDFLVCAAAQHDHLLGLDREFARCSVRRARLDLRDNHIRTAWQVPDVPQGFFVRHQNPASRALVHVRSATSAQRIRTQALGSTESARHTPSSPRDTHSSSGLVSERPRRFAGYGRGSAALCGLCGSASAPCHTRALCLFIALVDPKSLSHSEHSTPDGERIYGEKTSVEGGVLAGAPEEEGAIGFWPMSVRR
ncbi:hypothetical protein T492DRAFT_833712 [Pavlovales sp. CCMP2436]|nr:hypothetical protein T492DRAFT_833712 [Pavlovales sp. CCMP2436]